MVQEEEKGARRLQKQGRAREEIKTMVGDWESVVGDSRQGKDSHMDDHEKEDKSQY